MTRLTRSDRSLASAAAGAAGAAILGAIWLGLAVSGGSGEQAALATYDIAPPPPPPAIPDPQPADQLEGAAAPPALRADPAPVSAPEVPVPVPSPRPVPPVAGEGVDASAGAAERPGPGMGAGGEGTGLGSGAGGAGTGGGLASRARRVRGGINIRDFDADAASPALRPLVLHLSISAEGRVTDCTVAQPSGRPALDARTCQLARSRFRYEPARDASGRAVPDVAGWRQRWWSEDAGE
ncbi:energy transducer TonB [Sphingosinithalassobacter sp. CS137]|uniref:energy transducer TonB n=1 Tax=Sphingosinithalassobacter sp. CS137 TaxID=2762748 RepID=UPI00165DAC22|nr:energy transducer TonB [Sphingosinithalassobacter sp. CS137]